MKMFKQKCLHKKKKINVSLIAKYKVQLSISLSLSHSHTFTQDVWANNNINLCHNHLLLEQDRF